MFLDERSLRANELLESCLRWSSMLLRETLHYAACVAVLTVGTLR